MESMDTPKRIHIRLEEPLKAWFLETVFPTVTKGVFAEEVGTEKEGLHYHCIFESTLTPSTFKKLCCDKSKELGYEVARGKANGLYGACKYWPDGEFAYACKQGKILASKGLTDEELTAQVALGKQKYAHKTIAVKPKATPEDKFIRFCEDQFGWVRDSQFPLLHRNPDEDDNEYSSSYTTEPVWKSPRHINLDHYNIIVRRAVIRYMRGRVYRNQFIAMARNCLYVFATPELKEMLELWFEATTEL